MNENKKDKKKNTKLTASQISNLIAFAALCASIISWKISCDSNDTSREANTISRDALKIAKTAELPYFKLNSVSHQDKDEIII